MRVSAEVLGSLSLWAGALGGAVALVELLLSEAQKKRLADVLATTWIWLADQRAGRYVTILWNRPVQTGFTAIAVFTLLAILSDFAARLFWQRALFKGDTQFQMGHPRLYPWQVIVEITAIVLWLPVLLAVVQPRLVSWFRTHQSLRAYLFRLTAVFALCWLAIGVYVIGFVVPVYGNIDPFQNESLYRSAVETRLGGPAIVISLHVLSSLVAAPLMIEVIILLCSLALSIYWLLLVGSLTIVVAVFRFLLLRVADNAKGPLVATSAGLLALSGILKLFAMR